MRWAGKLAHRFGCCDPNTNPTHLQPLPVREEAFPHFRRPRARRGESKREDQVGGTQDGFRLVSLDWRFIMAFVRVEQRNARLASAVKVEYVKGRDGEVAKGTVTIISNTRRGSGDDRAEEATAIQWTLWGTQAQNAALFLPKGSHVNVVGRLRNNNSVSYTHLTLPTIYSV